MKSYCLKIAGYTIGLVSGKAGPDLVPSERFRNNITRDGDCDFKITVHSSPYELPASSVRVFHAPLFEEITGIPKKKSDNFWSVWKNRNDLFIKTTFPYSGVSKSAILRFSLTGREWDLYLNFRGDSTDPLDYPIDSLILYYLTVITGDIFIHASGINHSGHGLIFSGISGKGKSTMAGIWKDAGARIIHDDRLIIRNISNSYTMHNTPVYRDDAPSVSTVNRIFLIRHGSENRIEPLSGASAVSRLLANCIQHNWDHEIVAKLIGSVSIMCSVIPVFKLYFRPDRSIVDYIIDHE